MLRTSLGKVVIVGVVSLVVPGFISIFKVPFDELISQVKADVLGASIVRVQTVTKPIAQNQSEPDQQVIIDLVAPRGGDIINTSKKPFIFPTPQAENTPELVNNQKPPVSFVPDGPDVNKYTNLYADKARGQKPFVFVYGGAQGNNITFASNNDYNMNNVSIEITWVNGSNKIVSKYTTDKIIMHQSVVLDKNKTADSTPAYNPSVPILSIRVIFRDKPLSDLTGVTFTENL